MARGAIAGALALCAVAVLAGGCGETVLDANEVGGEIGARIEELTGAEVESVVCPSDVEAKAGTTFTCTVTGTDGTSLTIAVRQTSADGALAFEAPILPTTETEQVIAADLGDGSVVDCPELVLVEAGKSFDCALSGGSDGGASVRVTLKDENGNFDYEVTR